MASAAEGEGGMKFGWQTPFWPDAHGHEAHPCYQRGPGSMYRAGCTNRVCRQKVAERMGTRALAMLIGTAVTAFAAPPPGVDLNSPIHTWFEDLRAPDTGILCCSEADCRRVQYRITGDHYEVFIDRKRFGEYAPDKWLPVPDKVVLHRHDNPLGEAVACYYAGEIHCFIEASGT